MPHVIVKLWPGESQQEQQRLADAIVRDVKRELDAAEASVSVAFEEVDAGDWKEQVYGPDIASRPERLFKRPGYSM